MFKLRILSCASLKNFNLEEKYLIKHILKIHKQRKHFKKI